MLNQILLARPLSAGIVEQKRDGLPLVEAGEDNLFAALASSCDRVNLFGCLLVYKTLKNLQPVIALKNLFPQVGGCGAIRVDRVTCTAVPTPVEGQEHRFGSGELRRHLNFVIGDGKVYERSTTKLQERLTLRQAIFAILPYGVINRLSVIGLQLGRRYRQAVNEEHQIDGIVRVLLRMVYLAHHSKPVLLVVFLSDRVH